MTTPAAAADNDRPEHQPDHAETEQQLRNRAVGAPTLERRVGVESGVYQKASQPWPTSGSSSVVTDESPDRAACPSRFVQMWPGRAPTWPPHPSHRHQALARRDGRARRRPQRGPRTWSITMRTQQCSSTPHNPAIETRTSSPPNRHVLASQAIHRRCESESERAVPGRSAIASRR